MRQEPSANWEEILHALEDAGFAVERPRSASHISRREESSGFYGGLEPAFRRALAAVGTEWDARIGAAGRRLLRSRQLQSRDPGRSSWSPTRAAPVLAPLPLTLLPLERGRYEELEALGVRELGQLAGLPGGAVA